LKKRETTKQPNQNENNRTYKQKQ